MSDQKYKIVDGEAIPVLPAKAKEIVKNNGIVIPEDNPYNFELTDYDKPYALNINPSAFTQNKKDVLFDLNIEKVSNQYIEVFNESLRARA